MWSVAIPVLMGGPEVAGGISWAHPIGALHFRLDALGAFFLVWSLPMTLLGSVYAVGYLRKHFPGPRHVGVHFALLNMVALSFVLVYTGDEVASCLFGWEVAALAAWQLVIWDYTNQKVRFAGFNYLVSTHVGLLFLVAAVMILYTHSQSWAFADIGRWMSSHPGTLRNVVFLLLVTSFGLKSAFFPFHSWLPPAHAGAPAAASAVLSALVVKGSWFLVVRLWFDAMPAVVTFDAAQLLGGLGAAAIVVGSVVALRQKRLKLLVAYSTIAQIGYLFLMFPLAFDAATGALVHGHALTGGLLQAASHATAKAGMFMAAGLIYAALGHDRIADLGGVARALPVTVLAFAVAGLALMGVLPSGAYLAKKLLLGAAAGGGQWWWTMVLQGGAAFTAGYVVLVLTRALRKPPA
ncbi:MAG TPA: complex I subunit 5 family protein, partial [Polymorphobacter sp.]|nr:complex I subunit 5 family protein [Polymorphobacter sp.]